jgi:hypothetical protein
LSILLFLNPRESRSRSRLEATGHQNVKVFENSMMAWPYMRR